MCFSLSLCVQVLFFLLCHFKSHLSLSLLSRTSFSPSQHRCTHLCFFSLPLPKRTLRSQLSSIPPPALPSSYSRVHIGIRLHAHTLPCLRPTVCTCVPGFGPHTARVAAVESWKCWSCLIRRYNGGQHEDGQAGRQTRFKHEKPYIQK